MPKCSSCQKDIPWKAFDIISQLCQNCRDARRVSEQEAADRAEERNTAERAEASAETAADEKRQQQTAAAMRNEVTETEGDEEPLPGQALIAISIGIAFVSFLALALAGPNWFVWIGSYVASMICLVGIVRWGVDGSHTVHFGRLHRQNSEIIELLEMIADKGNAQRELDLLWRLRLSGDLSDDEFRRQRAALLRQGDQPDETDEEDDQ